LDTYRLDRLKIHAKPHFPLKISDIIWAKKGIYRAGARLKKFSSPTIRNALMGKKNQKIRIKIESLLPGGPERMQAISKINKGLMVILSGVVVLPALFVGAAYTPAVALDDVASVRCDQESIITGDTEYQVKTTCGEPDTILIKGLARKVWIYNFGPTRFIYYLTFVNGRLTRIQTGEYGHYD
jgi:hypothetical protein